MLIKRHCPPPPNPSHTQCTILSVGVGGDQDVAMMGALSKDMPYQLLDLYLLVLGTGATPSNTTSILITPLQSTCHTPPLPNTHSTPCV